MLSDPDRRATYDRYGHEGLRSGGYVAQLRRVRVGVRHLRGVLRRRQWRVRRHLRRRQRSSAAARSRAATSRVGAEITSLQAAQRRHRRGRLRGRRPCEHCRGNGAEPGTPIETCPSAAATGQLRAVIATPFGQVVRAAVCDACGGDGRVAQRALQGSAAAAGARSSATRSRSTSPPGSTTASASGSPGRGHAGERGGPAGDLYVPIRVREDPRFVRDGDDLVTAVDVAAPLAALGTTVEVPTIEGADRARDPRRHPAPRDAHDPRRRDAGAARPPATATCGWSSTSSIPRL